MEEKFTRQGDNIASEVVVSYDPHWFEKTNVKILELKKKRDLMKN